MFVYGRKILSNLIIHFIYLKPCVFPVFKQQEAEDTPKLLYNEFGHEWLLDVGFSGTHVLCEQLARRVDTWRYRYFSTPIHTSPVLHCLQPILAISVLACAVVMAAQDFWVRTQVLDVTSQHDGTFCVIALILLSYLYWKERSQHQHIIVLHFSL